MDQQAPGTTTEIYWCVFVCVLCGLHDSLGVFMDLFVCHTRQCLCGMVYSKVWVFLWVYLVVYMTVQFYAGMFMDVVVQLVYITVWVCIYIMYFSGLS